MPMANKKYFGSRKVFQSTMAPAFLGGSLGRMPKLQKIKQTLWIKHAARIVHGNPILGNKALKSAEYNIPPVALPMA
ncbi:hypothetical protein K3495_g2940 [Podosphaera aphanis]|nr:hypothetical protein K3495_g2940 [Podosphaera aphanis]